MGGTRFSYPQALPNLPALISAFGEWAEPDREERLGEGIPLIVPLTAPFTSIWRIVAGSGIKLGFVSQMIASCTCCLA
jgi:hypothetical protein